MKRFIKAISALFKIAKNPWLLNKVFEEPALWETHVDKKYNLKSGLRVIDAVDMFGEEYSEELNVFTFLDGGSLVTDIALLKTLAAGFKNCSYFEIGTWRGESVCNIAEVAESCYTLNLSDAEMRKMGVKESYIDMQSFFSKNLKNVKHLKGNSRSFDFASLNKKFDLIFIDGSHHYEDVKNDSAQVFKHLVHEKSIVVWHDYGVTPEHIRYEVLAGIMDGTPSSIHKQIYHVGHTKSAIFYPINIKSKKLKTPVVPEAFYKVGIKYQRLETRSN